MSSVSYDFLAAVLMLLPPARYGINSFVYTARRPFSPAKLYELVHDKFVILEPQEDAEEGDDEDEDEAENHNDNASNAGSSTSSDSDSGIAIDSSSDDVDEKAGSPPLQHDYPDVPLHLRLANKKAHPIFKTLLRSSAQKAPSGSSPALRSLATGHK